METPTGFSEKKESILKCPVEKTILHLSAYATNSGAREPCAFTNAKGKDLACLKYFFPYFVGIKVLR